MNVRQEADKLDDQTLAELDAYASDGQYIGTVTRYLSEEPENQEEFDLGIADIVGPDGRLENKRRVLIDGIGTMIQTRLAVPVDALTVDLKGRRVTVPLTVGQIESLRAKAQND